MFKNFETSLTAFENEVNTNISEILSLVDLEEDLAGSFGFIFEKRIGNCYSQEELDSLLENAHNRFDLNIPPGYKDKNKSEIVSYNGVTYLKKYGDLILWYQILDKACEESITKVVFITDDHKEDWWYRIGGKTIGPRAELKNEMLRISQADFFMFNSNSFLNQFELEKSNLIIEDIDLSSTKAEIYDQYYDWLLYKNENEELIDDYKWLLLRKKETETEKKNIESKLYEVEQKIILLKNKFSTADDYEDNHLKELILKNQSYIQTLESELENTQSRLDAFEKEIFIYEHLTIDKNDFKSSNRKLFETLNRKWEY